MMGRKEAEPGSKTLTVVAEGVVIEGKIFSKGSTRIDGSVFGEIVTENEFILGKEGKVEANVKTNRAVIAGSFRGEMVAAGEVDITPTGKFMGSLVQKDAMLTIQKGGLFRGESIISDNQEIFKNENQLKNKQPVKLIRPEINENPVDALEDELSI